VILQNLNASQCDNDFCWELLELFISLLPFEFFSCGVTLEKLKELTTPKA
jgi:hypothetical protein